LKTNRLLYTCLLLAIFTLGLKHVSLAAYDFGLVVNQNVGYGNNGTDDNKIDYQADILPRFSGLVGDNGDFFVSAGMTLGYENDFYYVPEILRTEFSLRFGNFGIRAGRISYSDPLSLIAIGLFDGVQFSHNSTAGSFNIGAMYTGLLYKKNANITMTAIDQEKYDSVLNYSDFYDTYFAPPRFLASLGWEHPSVGEFLRLKTSIIGQFDLADADEKYHSQYIILKAGIPVNSLLFELGGSLELSQALSADEDSSNIAFAGVFGVYWTLPSSFSSRLSFTGTIAGGKVDDSIGAFVPITTKYYGSIFEQKMSGLSVFDLNYSARLSGAVGTSLSMLYFVRNDLGTFRGYPLSADNDGYFLGAELFARIIWSPVSDLQLNLGGGAFLPSMGNAGPDSNPWWRIELTAILAIL